MLLNSSGGKSWTSSTSLAMAAVLELESIGEKLDVGEKQQREDEAARLEGIRDLKGPSHHFHVIKRTPSFT